MFRTVVLEFSNLWGPIWHSSEDLVTRTLKRRNGGLSGFDIRIIIIRVRSGVEKRFIHPYPFFSIPAEIPTSISIVVVLLDVLKSVGKSKPTTPSWCPFLLCPVSTFSFLLCQPTPSPLGFPPHSRKLSHHPMKVGYTFSNRHYECIDLEYFD